VPTRLAVFGDVHGAFGPDEARAVDQRGYDGVLFVGDLGGALPGSLRRVARAIATLRTPTVVLPGNHDGPSPLGILREAVLGGWHPPGAASRLLRRTARIERWLGPVPMAGYSLHPMGDVTVLAARPWAMDGRRASFAKALARRHQVGTLAESTDRLCQLLDQVSGPVVLLAHNGPAGLGLRDEDPWSHRGRDIGDTDLTAALRHGGGRVRAVVAGHMHLGSTRDAIRSLDGALCVNAAEVPRRGRHIVLSVGDDRATASWAS
jgi:uncharacterized protein (TIGR04168 family)